MNRDNSKNILKALEILKHKWIAGNVIYDEDTDRHTRYLKYDDRLIEEAIKELEDISSLKVTTWYLKDENESYYSCNNCKYDFLLANESSLRENSINFCPSCGYKIEEIIESQSQQNMQ